MDPQVLQIASRTPFVFALLKSKFCSSSVELKLGICIWSCIDDLIPSMCTKYLQHVDVFGAEVRGSCPAGLHHAMMFSDVVLTAVLRAGARVALCDVRV